MVGRFLEGFIVALLVMLLVCVGTLAILLGGPWLFETIGPVPTVAGFFLLIAVTFGVIGMVD